VTFTQNPTAGSLITLAHNATTIVVVTASDGNGNTTPCNVTLTAKDVTVPVITACFSPATLYVDPVTCNVALPDYTGDVTATDNCDQNLTATQSPVPGALLAVGTHTVTVTVEDDGGNTASCSETITVTVTNVAPVADAGGPYTADLGDGLTLDGSGSTDPNVPCGDVLTYEWEIDGDNLFDDATGVAPVLSAAFLNSLGAGTYTIYLKVTDNFGAFNISAGTTLTIYDNRPIPAFTYNPQSPQCNQSVSFDGSTSTHGKPGQTIVLYEWDFNYNGVTFTPSITGITPSHTFTTTGNFVVALRVTDNNSPAKTAITFQTLTVGGVCGTSVGGTYRYFNTALTPLNGITVELKQGGVTEYSTVTDASGNYAFPFVEPGTYDVVSSTSKSTGGAINSLDAGMVNAWGTGPQYTIEKVRFRAGDVIYDNFFDAGDAGRINNYYLQNGNPTWLSPVTLWTFWRAGETVSTNSFSEGINPTITVVASPLVQDFYGLVTGDFNLSFIPGPAKSGGSVTLNTTNAVVVAPGDEVLVPVMATAAMNVGAVSLTLDYPAHLAEVLGVYKGASPTVTMPYNLIGQQLRIGWFSSSPLVVNAGETLFTIRLKVQPSASNGETIAFTLTADPSNELGDQQMHVIPNAVLNAGSLKVSTIGIENPQNADLLPVSVYPNPAANSATLEYTVPMDGNVTIEAYNMLGQKQFDLFRGAQASGKHQLQFDVGKWSAGVYMLKIKIDNESKLLTGTCRILINR
jgi:hypothetical protein